MAGEPRAPQVGRVAEPGQRIVQHRIVAKDPPGLRLAIDHRRPQVIRVTGPQQLSVCPTGPSPARRASSVASKHARIASPVG